MTEYDTNRGAQGGQTAQTVLIAALLLVGFLMLRGAFPLEQAAYEPRIIIATPTLGLRPLPTLMPTIPPPQVIYIDRPAPAPAVIEDNSVNVCIGFCPDGGR